MPLPFFNPPCVQIFNLILYYFYSCSLYSCHPDFVYSSNASSALPPWDLYPLPGMFFKDGSTNNPVTFSNDNLGFP